MKLISFPNLGNTCYLNSVLQNIIYNNDFDKLLKSDENTFNTELQKIVNIIHSEPFEIVNYNLIKFINYFTTEKKLFNKYEQQDAHEFLVSFIDLIKNDEYTGQLRLNIKCTRCNNIKQVYEDFNSINLNIPEIKSINIYSLFYNKATHHYDRWLTHKRKESRKSLKLLNIITFFSIVLQELQL